MMFYILAFDWLNGASAHAPSHWPIAMSSKHHGLNSLLIGFDGPAYAASHWLVEVSNKYHFENRKKVSNEKPSAIEIARRISISEKSNLDRRRSSLGNLPSPHSKPPLQKSNTVDSPTPTTPTSPTSPPTPLSPTIKSSLSPDIYGAAKPPKSPRSNPTSPNHPMKVTHPLKDVSPNQKPEANDQIPANEKPEKDMIEPKSGGTWFGSKKSSKPDNRPLATDAIKNIEIEKEKEQNVLKELDEATLDRNENQQVDTLQI